METEAGAMSCIDMGEGPEGRSVRTRDRHQRRPVAQRTRAELSVDTALRSIWTCHFTGRPRPERPGLVAAWVRSAFSSDLIERLRVDQVDLVANDTGGAVAQVFAAGIPNVSDRSSSPTATHTTTFLQKLSSP